jgi:hypothetical protein
MCPDQPALADKIPTRWGWELIYPEDDIAKEETAKKEMAKIKEARELFGRLVAREKIKLRGVLDPSKPLEDIDPADAEDGMLAILTGELRVFLNNKLVRTYRQVRCYETDVDRCAAELRSETKSAKWTSPAELEKFVKDYKTGLGGGEPPTVKVFTEAAEAKGIKRPRKDLRAARAALGPIRRGRRPNLPKK